MERRLYTIPDVADLLRVSKWTVYRILAARQIPHLRIGNSVRFTEAHVERFLREAQRNTPAADDAVADRTRRAQETREQRAGGLR